jgi:hypothetical protein
VNALSAEYDAKRFDATDIADSPNKSIRIAVSARG